MKNLLLVVSIAFLGACSNYTTGNARSQCCSDALANGKTCCEDTGTTNAKAMTFGALSTTAATKECSAAASSCDSAKAASCESKAAMSCCDEASASGKACADCVKP